ncbi:MAG TPA: hypothetical protein VF916_04530 [Ktedonobacterales bacterium]
MALVVDSIEALIDGARAPDASLAMRQAAFSLIVVGRTDTTLVGS